MRLFHCCYSSRSACMLVYTTSVRNSSKLIWLSPSWSTSSMISVISSSVKSCANFFMRTRISSRSMYPLPSASKISKTSRKFCSASSPESPIRSLIKTMNSSKSISLSPFTSTRLIMSWISSSVGLLPNSVMTCFNSPASMVPPPSMSNMAKASRNSIISWSVKSRVSISSSCFFGRSCLIVAFRGIVGRPILKDDCFCVLNCCEFAKGGAFVRCCRKGLLRLKRVWVESLRELCKDNLLGLF
mmetsp:Transcript_123/g.244  ORF Transcript_123/g.244 Transcript_123/m.244 type:complete len:243 (+) Transcript_123:50-778(+)